MPSFTLRNERYRDEILKFSYPFDELSTLNTSSVYIGTDLIIDASLYFKEGENLPVHISSIDGTYGDINTLRFNLSDSVGELVATCTVDYDTEVGRVFDTRGTIVGTIVFNLPGLRRFIGKHTGSVTTLLSTVAVFSLDASSSSQTNYLRYVIIGDTPVSGDVVFVARHGVAWRLDEGVLRLDLLGNPPAAAEGGNIKRINGVANKSIWLTHHPRLNMRIGTNAQGLVFSSVGDLK